MAKDIDLDRFLALMDGDVTEGDNGTFYVDESGVRSTIAPTVAERDELIKRGGLFDEQGRNKSTGALLPSEADVVREFARECRLTFPVTLEEAKNWAVNVLGVDLDPPGKGPIPRRKRLDEIIKAMQEIDPDLSIKDMPGTKGDLLDLCKALDNHLFAIAESSFSSVIKGWIAFAGGRHKGTSDYYSADRLNEVRSRLG